MSDQWSYMDFQDLLDNVLLGNISIHNQINVYSSLNDKIKTVSFLSYLLSYKNVSKNNIFYLLFTILQAFHMKILDMNKNKCISLMIKQIMKEWDNPETTLDLKSLVKQDVDKLLSRFNDFCSDYDLVENQARSEAAISVLNRSQVNTPNLKEKIHKASIECESVFDEVNKYQESLLESKDVIESFSIYPFIDLSMKHKSLYLLLCEDDNITDSKMSVPENINTIFLNFVYVYNLFYKQLYQQVSFAEQIKNELENRKMSLRMLKENIGIVAVME
jgi:hypothetical protein